MEVNSDLPLWKRELIDTGVFTPSGIEGILYHKGTKEEWVDDNQLFYMVCAHRLPKGWHRMK